MWFLERVGRSVENLTMPSGDRARSPRAPFNVLTPDRIPEFFIPPTLPAAPDHAAGRDGPAEGPRRDLVKAGSLYVIQIENVDQDWSCASEEEEGGDGGLRRACRVPLRANAAEIIYLPESPHTRRKESLFHARGPRWRDAPREGPLGLSSSPPGLRPSANPRTFGALDSDTASSTESSPFSSPLLTRSLAGTLVRRAVTQQTLFARRAKPKAAPEKTSSLSADECSSADNSPGVPRRPEWTGGRTPCSLAPPPTPLYPLDLVHYQQRLTTDSALRLDTGGTVRLSAEYIAESRRLRLRLVNGEGLYPRSFEPRCVNCCVTLCLLPGKVQKQRSSVIKRSRNPIFNEDFFFEGITEDDLESKTVKVKVLNKGSGLKRDCVMGETQLRLASLLPNLHTLTMG